MIEHLCDRCKRSLDPEVESTYHVSVEISSAVDGPVVDVSDDDLDQLSELHSLLEKQCDEDELPGLDRTESMPLAVKTRDEYHLCADCHKQWIQNPIGRDRLTVLGFSNN